MAAQQIIQQVSNKLSEFKNDPVKVKKALGATGAVVLFAGGLIGLQTVLKNKQKPTIKNLSPAISYYLQYNEDWYHLIAALSDYSHFAPQSFERLAEAVTHLIYLTSFVEAEQNYTKLINVSKLIGIIVECVRVIRAYLVQQYHQVPQVMTEFDEVAANIQQLCNDTQFNVENIIAYNKLTQK